MSAVKKVLLLVFLILFIDVAFGAAPAKDNLFLYNNGAKINESILLFEERNETKVCYGGTCRISKYILPYNITLLITAEDDEILSSDLWCDNWKLNTPGCEGFVTMEDELGKAHRSWERSSEYKNLQSKIYNSSGYEKQRLFDEQKQKRLEFMQSKGFDFYGNSCRCDYTAYHKEYLTNLFDNAQFKAEVKIYNQSINFTEDQWDDRCFNVDIALGHSERIQCPEDDTFWNRLVLFIFLLAGILLLKYFTYLIIWIILIGLGIYTVRRILKKRGMKKGTKK